MTEDSLKARIDLLLAHAERCVKAQKFMDACVHFSGACRLLALAIKVQTTRVVRRITDPKKNQN